MSLVTYIKNDLIAGFRAGLISQRHLTLADLSSRYQVSATPVRAAVKQLIHEGYLEQQGNKRLAIRMIGAGPVNCETAVPEPPKDWYRIVANDLIRLSLRGEPLLLREESTAEKYGISRSSIREIFSRLAGEGVLEHIRRCGWRLRPLRPADLDAYTDIRVLMELKALEEAWPRLVDEDLSAMLAENHLAENPGDPPVVDDSLHGYLVKKAGNPYISDFFARHGERYRNLFVWIGLDHSLEVQVVHDHRRILQALLRRDRPAADKALVEHIRHNQPFLKQRMQDESIDETIGNYEKQDEG